MSNKISQKVQSNLKIYKEDIKTKGLFLSIIHRLYKIPGTKMMLSHWANYFKPDYVVLGEQKLYIDKFDTTISENLLVEKKWENFETQIFTNAINSSDIVLDIGAHIGYYTLIAAKKVGGNGKVFAFEPDQKNFFLLEKNINQNGYKNVKAINKAVSNKNERIKLYKNKKNTGDHRIYNSQDNREAVDIQTISLDNFFKNDKMLKKINLIKMDIQGAEVNAIKGALNLLKNPKIKIITEFWPFGMKLNQTSAKVFLDLLIKNNFKLYEIDEQKNKLTKTTPRILLKKYPETQDIYTNLLCIKN